MGPGKCFWVASSTSRWRQGSLRRTSASGFLLWGLWLEAGGVPYPKQRIEKDMSFVLFSILFSSRKCQMEQLKKDAQFNLDCS